MAYRLVVLGLIIIAVLLQVRLWSTQGGLAELWYLQKQVAALSQKVAQQQAENQILVEKIHALKHDPQAVEALARKTLGMLKEDEQFIRLITLKKSDPSASEAAFSAQNTKPE